MLKLDSMRAWLIALAVILGGCAFLWFPGGLGHVFRSAHLAAERAHCRSNLGMLASAMLAYAESNDGAFPDAGKWMDKLQLNVAAADRNPLRCPAVEAPGYGYAMNAALSGKKRGDWDRPDKTPLLFDSVLLGRNAASGLESLPKPGRHYKENMIAYADGHVRFLLDKDARR